MKQEAVYSTIFEQVKKSLSEKYSKADIPSSSDFEEAALEVLTSAAKDYDVSVQPLGKRKFPDLALTYLPDGEKVGVEVKLHTVGAAWTTLGNSAYASSQEPGLETIFLLFGNFEKTPPAFEVKPYADCVTDIKITHSPRYMIDMGAKTDFCQKRLGISFDQLRNMDEADRAVYVNTYIAKTKYEELSAAREKEKLVAQGFVLFPEFFSANKQIRYRRMSVWLFAKNILCRNVRDFISASGQAPIRQIGPEELPRIFTSLLSCKRLFKEELKATPSIVLENSWSECGYKKKVPESPDERIKIWLTIVSNQYGGASAKIPGTEYGIKAVLKKVLAT